LPTCSWSTAIRWRTSACCSRRRSRCWRSWREGDSIGIACA